MMNEFVFVDLKEGHSESLTVELTQAQVEDFIALSGDASTVHVDDDYARSRGFQKRLVHGALVVAYMSHLIGMKLPGKHGVLRALTSEFRKPCYAPGRLILVGRVTRLVPTLRLAKLAIEVTDSSGELIVSATAEIVLKT